MSNRLDAWDKCDLATGAAVLSRKPTATFEHFSMLAQATAAGAGAAIIPRYLIGDELADGRLVEIPGVRLKESEGAYYLVYPTEKLEKAAFRKFRRWLLQEAAGESGAKIS
ncbi:LysR substrate-binding domain-containing protein [Novosphingobium sp. Gsoil 351]|uniref:LysR substrate-binding domain-containing protein n=1 Tax=Novosphingobium sp. Gsoil 351 TaxID=2675225 RepID=UPI002104EFD0|nr:LysR substrate-binding domain-containing protein [Novosphingobium sp. Gsoil 351]